MSIKDKVTKKIYKQIEALGWPLLEPTWEDVWRFAMENYKEFIMVIPRPHMKWWVTITLLDKPNSKDGKLNLFEVANDVESYDHAIRLGVEEFVTSHYQAKKTLKKMMKQPDYEKQMAKLKEWRIKEGIDI